eukprot:15190832-Alexandrium_andersonii.AAC.1
MEASDGKRPLVDTTGKCPLKFIHMRDFKDYPRFIFSERPMRMMLGPQLTSRFLENGELVGDRAPGAYVFHADPGISRGSAELPADLVEFERAGMNARVLVEGDAGWEEQKEQPGFGMPAIWSVSNPVTSRVNTRISERERVEVRSSKFQVPDDAAGRSLAQQAFQVDDIIHDDGGLPRDSEKRI